MLSKLFHLLALLPLVLSAPTSQPHKRVLTPDTDPFYQPPSGFEFQTPGAILRTRTITASFLGLVPVAVQSYQILYRTTAVNGSAIAGTTTVFKPLISYADRFVSFHTAYDGSSTLCNPSYNYQFDASQVDLISDFEFLLLEVYLASGYVVSSPDYEGPDAAFGAGRLAGAVVLDSMRAVSNFHSTLGFSTSTPSIVGNGYSGGSIATSWAAALLSSYAPELPVKGWATGGTVANLTETALFLDNTAFSGFLPPSINGLNNPSAYAAQLNPIYQSIFTTYGQSLLIYAENNCITNLINFFEQSVLTTDVQSLGADLYYQSTISEILAEQTLGANAAETPASNIPVYLYHATADEIIPYAGASTLASSWCANGASVNFVTYANGGHLTTEILGFVGAFQFAQSAFAGTVATGCSSSTSLSNSLDPVALGVSLEPILTSLVNALAALGRGDANVISNLGTLNQTVTT